jgi:hypothetical protein
MRKSRKVLPENDQYGQPSTPLDRGFASKANRTIGEVEGQPVTGKNENDKKLAAREAIFKPCTIVGPDGISRNGWEMWIEKRCFGRSDSKEMLLMSYERLQNLITVFNRSDSWQQRRPDEKRRTFQASGSTGNDFAGEVGTDRVVQ